MNGEEIKGAFYEQELEKSTQDIFHIEKVLRCKSDKLLVKRLGNSDAFKSRIDKDTIGRPT